MRDAVRQSRLQSVRRPRLRICRLSPFWGRRLHAGSASVCGNSGRRPPGARKEQRRTARREAATLLLHVASAHQSAGATGQLRPERDEFAPGPILGIKLWLGNALTHSPHSSVIANRRVVLPAEAHPVWPCPLRLSHALAIISAARCPFLTLPSPTCTSAFLPHTTTLFCHSSCSFFFQ